MSKEEGLVVRWRDLELREKVKYTLVAPFVLLIGVPFYLAGIVLFMIIDKVFLILRKPTNANTD